MWDVINRVRAEAVKSIKNVMGDNMSQLTDEQLKNWRRVLRNQYGTLEELFDDKDIHRYRDLLEEFGEQYPNKDPFPIVDFMQSVVKRSDPSIVADAIARLGE